MIRHIYIVRHGNTFDKGDTVTRVGARTDLALSNSGKGQAAALGNHFADAAIQFDRILSSPLQRTHQTARAICGRQSGQADIEFCEFLREIDYGPDENRPEPEVIARIGEQALSNWEEKALVPKGWRVDPAAIKQAWADCFASLTPSEAQNGPVLIVTSNGIARFALQLAEGEQRSQAPLKLATGAIGRIDITENGELSVNFWNQRPEIR
ncbi:MAG: hypothetical protein Hens3KO_29390 [Henriciella sp.]